MLRLTYLGPADSSPSNGRMAQYLCACGRTVTLPQRKVLNGDIHSCGCWRSERMRRLAQSQRARRRGW